MRKLSVILVLVIVFLISLPGVSIAAALGTAFTYQGHLYDNNSAANHLYDFQFKLYDSNSGGSQIGADVNVPDIDVIDGYFTVELDFGNVFDANARWLEIGVIRHSVEYDPFLYTTLSPRQEITPTPFALYARTAGADNDWMLSGNDIYSIPSGNVGIGISTPLYRLHTVDTTANSDVPAIYGEHAVTDFYGVGVQGVGLYKGVAGSVSATGSSTYYGVAGSAETSSSEGIVYGVYGSGSGGGTSYGAFGANYSDSYGVYGISYGSGNYGYLGDSNHGVYGKNDTSNNFGYLGDDSYGMYGKNAASLKYGYIGGSDHGVYGESYNSGSGNFGYLGGDYGAYGESYNNAFGYLGGYSYGAYGEYNSSSYGYLGGAFNGVYGRNDYTNGFAVYGDNAGRGTVGYLGGNYGAYGSNNNNGTVGYLAGPYGVYGAGNSTHYAGYFLGDVWVTGSLSAADVYDRTPYPKDLATAYQAVMSMERLGDGQYMENNKEKQLDHSTLSDFIRSEDGHRNLSATVSCQNEVLKDLIRKQDQLGKDSETIELLKQQVEVLQTENGSLKQRLDMQEKTLQQLQAVFTKGAIQ